MPAPDSIATLTLVEIALRAGGISFIPVSELPRPGSTDPFVRPIRSGGYAIVGLDLTLCRDGSIRLIEANGSNQGASSFGQALGDVARARHQVQAARERLEAAERGVVLIPFAPHTGLLAEILVRARMIQAEIERFRPCALVDSSQAQLGPMAVVVDSVPNIAKWVSAEGGQLFYRSSPVVSAANPNLLPALVRLGVVERTGYGYGVDGTIFHDGPLLTLIHDKGLQQDIASGTGISPLWWRECRNINECIEAVAELGLQGKSSVVKMNAGSGGAGIEFFPPSAKPSEVALGVQRLLGDVAAQYGDHVHRSLWPLRVFEFVASTGFPAEDGPRLWDMRVLCLISPGQVEMAVGALRLCPEPYDPGSLDRGAVLSNTTGRKPSLHCLRSPLTDGMGPTDTLRVVGVDDTVFATMLSGCAQWCEAAWQRCAPVPEALAG